MSPAGRRPGSPPTREAIIRAAQAEFETVGYTAASLRSVARRAGVDPALINHYFSDKAGLFVSCLKLPLDPRAVRDQARAGPPDGQRIAERFLAQWERDPAQPGHSFVTLMQAVSSSPPVARALREFLTERVWARPEQDDSEAGARATALVSSQLLGAAWARYVIEMEPFASASRAEVAAWIGPTIDAYIDGSGTRRQSTPLGRFDDMREGYAEASMPESPGTSVETQLVQTLVDLRERIAGDDEFAFELYRGLTNRRWRLAAADDLSLSWGHAEDIINEQRRAAGQPPLNLRQTGGEGELGDDVQDELSRRGWKSKPLDTGRHHEAHATNPESAPPAEVGERMAPSQPPEPARRAHDEADAEERLFPGRPGQSASKAGRDPQERR